MDDLSKLLKQKKQDAIVLKISIEPTVQGETLEKENMTEGIAPPLEGKEQGGDGTFEHEAAEAMVEGLPEKEMVMDDLDDVEKRKAQMMMMKKDKGLLGKTSLEDKVKMEMMKAKR